MDWEDEQTLRLFWAKIDEKLTDMVERECWKILPRLDKLAKETLGLRRRRPEDFLDRFNRFMDFVHEVYLTPSLVKDPNDSDDVCSGSDNDFGDCAEPSQSEGEEVSEIEFRRQ